MKIYMFMFMLVMVLMYLVQVRQLGRILRMVFYISAIFILVVMSGFRHESVGTDTSTYIGITQGIRSFYDLSAFKLEKGYGFICLLANSVSSDYAALLLLVVSVIASVYFYGIVRHSKFALLSIFCFVAEVYFYHYNAQRQALAAAFIFLALCAALEKRMGYYFLFCAAGMLFHKTALIAVPVYFFITNKFSLRIVFLSIICFFLTVAYMDYIVSFSTDLLDERYYSYGESHESTGRLSFLLALSYGIFLVYFRRYINLELKSYDMLLMFYCTGLIFFGTGVFKGLYASGFQRLAFYFTQSTILIWPLVYLNIREKRSRFIFITLFIIFGFLVFVIKTRSFGALVPYEWNPIVTRYFFSL